MKSMIRYKAGVTLTELLVVLAVVGLLATLAIPAVMERGKQARFVTARAECEALGKSEETCGLIHGYYVPLQLLDNIPAFSGEDTTRDDTIRNISNAIVFIDVHLSARDAFRNPIRAINQRREDDVIANWNGPFINFQRVYIPGIVTGSTNPPAANSNLVRFDYPLDPWGNPYRLYSPIGITGSTAGTSPAGSAPVDQDLNSDNFSDGRLTNVDDRFDRYAVVSFGPNGVSDGIQVPIGGNTTNNPIFGDDIVYFFGGEPRDTDTTAIAVVVTATPFPVPDR